PVGSDYPLLRVRVTRKVSDSPALPTRLSRLPHYTLADVANPDKPIPIGISEGPMSMRLNGRPYASNDLLPFERVPLDTIQLLEIFHAHGDMGGMGGGSASGEHKMDGGMQGMGGGMQGMGGMGMMFSMAHPIHLHGQSFRILSRTIGAGESSDYATVREGFIDEGLKDTVLVMPGERVRLIKPFQDYKGLFMYHCHNLEHEDLGMMREFLIE
ncbi:multicopper oxidase family protein, partial [Candidatus Woesearchaeota archaeon]|nr:multicopper oxidase family protein [Candidatus Woesearchaeota archaeon]